MLKLSLPWSRDALLLPLIIFICATFVFFLPSSISDHLIYDRALITAGEFWRLFTAHLVHTNDNHLLLNLAGLTMLWALHGDHYKMHTFLFAFSVSAIICSVGIFYFDVDMQRYVGLSGVLHGIFVWGTIKDIKKGWKTGYLLLFGVLAKIVYEQVFGASNDVEQLINARVAIDAHMWGAIGGLFYASLEQLWIRTNSTRK
ncbi:rhombosortase [Thalassotalea maritima]|uniref:rhombosortase n=1 Tax=Thalassotalea maritima TaxID=3242416 RepID=UPI0035272007